MSKLKVKWLVYATVGLILSGSGLCVIGEAIILKFTEAEFKHWFYVGLLGLILFHSGLSFFAQATIFRISLNKEKEK
jgi:hypothetical protein